MKSLRTQLLWSHLALVGLMVVLMVGSIVNFFRLGRSIDRILRDNYKSVVAAQTMKESLERQDSAATFFIAGQSQKAREQYRKYWPIFEAALKIESGNITEQGEKVISDDIHRRYRAYRAAMEKLLYANPPLPPERARAYYFRVLEPAFIGTGNDGGLKRRVQDVLEINQAAMTAKDAQAKQQARTASWLGIGVTIAALLLAVVFAQRAINASLTPLLALAQGAEEIGAGHLNRRIELNRNDEIGTLATAFNHMAEKLREARLLEQRRLHRAEQMSDAALENLYDPVLVTDATGTIVHLNRAAEGLFGAARNATGQPVARVVAEERIVAAIEHAIRQERVSAEEGEAAFIPLQVGEARRTYRLRATPMRDDDGMMLGAVLVLEDVTHLSELSRLKTEFIGVASHELRTPVTSLLLSAQLLQEGAAGPLTPDQQEIVRAQREDLQRLDGLMRDLLDITRLEAGVTPPRLEIVSPNALIESTAHSLKATAEVKGLQLEIVPGQNVPSVQADSAQLSRVLMNLLNNAIRHTPAGGRVSIETAALEDKVRFRVSDTGSGIPAEYLSHIFSHFVQVPGATRGGAGLGLSIAQSIVQAHAGEITVRSKVGEGSVFEFELPAVAK